VFAVAVGWLPGASGSAAAPGTVAGPSAGDPGLRPGGFLPPPPLPLPGIGTPPAGTTPGPDPVEPGPAPPAFASAVPLETTQVVRTVPSTHWCAKAYCSRTEAWEKVLGQWRIATKADGTPAVFRSTTGPKGFAAPGRRREDDGKSPSGIYAITITFSTSKTAPGPMPWRRRLPTSVIGSAHDKNYNTWIESKGIGNGARPSMRYGFWMDYNNPRLTPGVGPKPVVGLGSGIFYHTAWPGAEWVPTYGCVGMGNAEDMKWVVAWLDPTATPRVANNV
jgi:L,D-peptidoglycan transpeptidase YkuD (ErfK/YbiS/YcfS/YnhG family)